VKEFGWSVTVRATRFSQMLWHGVLLLSRERGPPSAYGYNEALWNDDFSLADGVSRLLKEQKGLARWLGNVAVGARPSRIWRVLIDTPESTKRSITPSRFERCSDATLTA
jgi:hypothetical protein